MIGPTEIVFIAMGVGMLGLILLFSDEIEEALI